MIDVAIPAESCGEDPATILMMLMVGGYGYIGCAVLALIITGLANYYANNFLPGDFGKLPRVKKCGGFLLRISFMLINLVHWILIAPVGYLLMTYFTFSECMGLAMGTQSIFFMIIPVLWFLQHVGGSIMRSFIDIEAHLIVPDDPEGSAIVQVLCVTCGP